MDNATAQLLIAATPLAIELIKQAAKQPDLITPEQWNDLRRLFRETYDERTARITELLRQQGSLPAKE